MKALSHIDTSQFLLRSFWAIQIVCDTFMINPSRVAVNVFQIPVVVFVDLWTELWTDKKKLYLALKNDFLLVNALKSEFKQEKKFMWHFWEP